MFLNEKGSSLSVEICPLCVGAPRGSLLINSDSYVTAIHGLGMHGEPVDIHLPWYSVVHANSRERADRVEGGLSRAEVCSVCHISAVEYRRTRTKNSFHAYKIVINFLENPFDFGVK